MGRLLDILKNTTINVTEAEFATVGDFWKNQVFYYKRDRLYYVTDGNADIILKEKTIHLQQGRLYLIPSHSVVDGNCRQFLSHHFVHFQFDDYAYNLFYSLSPKTEVEADEFDEHYFKLLEKYMLEKAQKPLSAQTELEINGIMQILISKFLPDSAFNDDMLLFVDIISYIDEHIQTDYGCGTCGQSGLEQSILFKHIHETYRHFAVAIRYKQKTRKSHGSDKTFRRQHEGNRL